MKILSQLKIKTLKHVKIAQKNPLKEKLLQRICQ